jgi:hypothetical protein
MESKKINQLATEMTPTGSDLTIIGDPITGVSRKITLLQLSATIGTGADLQGVTDNGATTTNPIAIGGLTITGLATGVLKSDSGVIASVPFGAANGVATLGGDGKVPSNQLPSYVDDVVEVANFAALPAIGETGKIYITLDNNKVYRWTGSTYVEIAANNAVWGAITGTLSNQTDLQNALNAKQNTITLTTTGTSGASTLVGSTLNIPNYSTDLSGYVPYTGATANVNLGTYTLLAAQIKATSSAGLSINANSGTQIADLGAGGGANMTLFGGLIGTSASFSSSVTGNTIVKSGGTSSQFLKADGSVDSTTYQSAITLTTTGTSGVATLVGSTLNIPNYGSALSGYLPLTGGTLTGFLTSSKSITSGDNGQISIIPSTNTSAAFFQVTNIGGTTYFGRNNNSGNFISSSPNATLIYSTDSSPIMLYTNGNQILTLTGGTPSVSGNVLINTSSDNGAKLQVSGNATILNSSGTGLDVASDLVIFRASTGFGSPRQITLAAGNGPTTYLEAKGFGGNYITDFGIRTYNSSGTAFEVFFATSAGNVGIGTTAPNGKFEVANLSSGVTVGDFLVDAANKNVYVGRLSSTSNDNTNFIVRNRIGTASLYVVGNSGNVGIGTSSPGNFNSVAFTGPFLDVAGILQIKGTSANGVAIIQLGGDTYRKATIETSIGTQDPFLAFGTASSGSSSANTERMRITSGGDVCVKTTTASFTASGRGNITIAGDSGSSAILGFKVGSVNRAYMFVNGEDTYLDNTSGTGLFIVLNGSGGVKLDRNATSWTSNSDEKLKNINGNIESALDKILTLRAVNFSWKTDETNKENLGLIAQDVEKVFPQVVNKSKLAKSINSDNQDETEYLGIRYTELIPVLIAAIQELKAEIEILKNK